MPVPAEAASPELVVRTGTFQPRLILSGELEAVESAPVIVPRTSVLQLAIRWMERNGAFVSEGQKILELDDSQFQEGLEEARIAESQAVNDLAHAEANAVVELAQLEFDVRRALVQLETAQVAASVPADLRSRREYRERQLELARAELGVDRVKENLRSQREATEMEIEVKRLELEDAREKVKVAEEAIEALTLRAPRDGILIVAQHPIDGRRLQVGDNVWVGLEVMSIPTLKEMKVVAGLSDVDDGEIAGGDRVRCTLDAYPDLTYEGRVAEIAPVAREEREGLTRRAFRVEIPLERSDPERMRPGMSVRVEVLGASIEGALLVPREALDLSSSPPRVRLASGGTREVKLGPCSAFECVAEEGLSEGAVLRRAS